MINYKCACGRKGVATEGQPKTCQGCGAVLTLGDAGVRPAPVLKLAYVQKAASRYVGKGDDAPLMTDRMKTDRYRELRDTLAKFKVTRVAELRDGDLRKFMDAMGLH